MKLHVFLLSSSDRCFLLLTNDLAAKHPGKVNEMVAMWQQWAESNRVFPLHGGTIPQRKEFKVAGE